MKTPSIRTDTLTREDYRILSLAALGGTLEFYDFIIFVFFATIMGQVFFPSGSPDWLLQIQTYAIFSAGYLARPLGGIIMAHFGDLHGRKRMFMLSVLLMALPTFIMGILPSYATLGIGAPALLLLMRLLQGAAIGGEIPGAWVFVAEHAPPRHVSLACGALTGGLTMGILLGSLVASAVHAMFSMDQLTAYAWRIPFILGGMFGLAAIYLRSRLHETPVFQRMQAEKTLAQSWPIKQVIHKHRAAVLLSMLATWMLTAGIVVAVLMTPTLLSKIPGISSTHALLANCLAVLCLSLSCVGYGQLIDRYGTALPLIVGAIVLALVSYGFYTWIPEHPNWLFPAYSLLGAALGVISTVPCIMVRAFPPAVRFSGLSFAYNIAYAIFGGMTPVLLVLLLHYDRLAPAHYISALCMLGVAIGCYLLFVESNERSTVLKSSRTQA